MKKILSCLWLVILCALFYRVSFDSIILWFFIQLLGIAGLRSFAINPADFNTPMLFKLERWPLFTLRVCGILFLAFCGLYLYAGLWPYALAQIILLFITGRFLVDLTDIIFLMPLSFLFSWF